MCIEDAKKRTQVHVFFVLCIFSTRFTTSGLLYPRMGPPKVHPRFAPFSAPFHFLVKRWGIRAQYPSVKDGSETCGVHWSHPGRTKDETKEAVWPSVFVALCIFFFTSKMYNLWCIALVPSFAEGYWARRSKAYRG